ncbi:MULTISPECIES: hypothetical protein [unclassified Microcoleus]|uniref:hypothetical protein n=1 Tax=unclassified Microcoleus TaxID=2642155 RepID=UPI002FD331CF
MKVKKITLAYWLLLAITGLAGAYFKSTPVDRHIKVQLKRGGTEMIYESRTIPRKLDTGDPPNDATLLEKKLGN